MSTQYHSPVFDASGKPRIDDGLRSGGFSLRRRLADAAFVALCVFAAAPAAAGGPQEQKFPDVIAVQVRAADGRFDFDVTVASPYDSPGRYADAFSVSDPDGQVYGERRLLHDHAGEQPFTRELYGVQIPQGVRRVIVQARDQRYGYGGRAVEAMLPGRQP